MSDWNAAQHSKLKEEQTIPAMNLANSLKCEHVISVLDIGCEIDNPWGSSFSYIESSRKLACFRENRKFEPAAKEKRRFYICISVQRKIVVWAAKSPDKIGAFCCRRHLFCLHIMARPEGFEPPAFGIGIHCDIQLRHGR